MVALARRHGIRVLEVVVEDPQNAAGELAQKVGDAVATNVVVGAPTSRASSTCAFAMRGRAIAVPRR